MEKVKWYSTSCPRPIDIENFIKIDEYGFNENEDAVVLYASKMFNATFWKAEVNSVRVNWYTSSPS